MRLGRVLLAAGSMVALVGCATAASQPTQAKPQTGRLSCGTLAQPDEQVAELLTSDKVHKVEPAYRIDDVYSGKRYRVRAHRPRRYIAGAKLYVPAEKGVTSAYLERTLTCHAASEGRHVHRNDPFKAKGIRDVDVEAAGPHFQIAITGADRHAGEAIWERARAFGPGQVEVRQVGKSPSRGAHL